MHPAICVDNLAKSYRLGLTHSRSVRELVNRAAAGVMRRTRRDPAVPSAEASSGASTDGLFWALRGVSFEVQPGEVVGIIGKNGAGKSTLLKILSRITPPTEGRIETRGRVASLLEVGTGFHPELTGRENVFLNGAILGMMRGEVARKLDAIVAFAEVEQFLDTPVKRYSSGMYVRLAFAVAAHLDPEILIVDEVLAVGDAAFQKKCLGKMSDLGHSGRTVLFVSHNIAAVEALTSRCIVLDCGAVGMVGPTTEAVRHYAESQTILPGLHAWSERHRDGDLAVFCGCSILDAGGQQIDCIASNESFFIELNLELAEPLTTDVAVTIENAHRIPIVGSLLSDSHRLERRVGRVAYRIRIDPNYFKPGSYLLTLSAFTGNQVHDAILHFPGFTVRPSNRQQDVLFEKRWGDLILPFSWTPI